MRTWLLWAKSKAFGRLPSEVLGIAEPGSYEAYCLDEAVFYFGTTLERMLEESGHRSSKEEKKAQMAQERILDRVMGRDKDTKGKFADPAVLFQK